MPASKSGLAESEPALYRPCVGIMLLNPAGEAFVGRRIGIPSGFSAWQMPQGGIDPGETPREAALRELVEEIGTAKAEIIGETTEWYHYDLPPALGGGPWGGRFRGQRQKWFAMRFTGADGDIDLATEHPEFDAWEWVAVARLPELIVEFKRAVYEAVLTEFAPLLRG